MMGPDLVSLHPVTVLVPTSTIPSHPSMDRVEELVRRVRAYPAMTDAPILFMVDGLRPEQAERAATYEEYKRRLVARCNWDREWRGCYTLVFDAFEHCACMTRKALGLVRSPLVFYLEHDMWPTGTIPWSAMFKALQQPGVNSIRLSMIDEIPPGHRHLYPGYRVPVEVCDVPLLKTWQWSQQPHLARTQWYQELMDTYFGWESRTGIEEVLYCAMVNRIMQGIDSEATWGVWVYGPEGSLVRCETRDGRQGDSKFTRWIRYDGETPTWAPAPHTYE